MKHMFGVLVCLALILLLSGCGTKTADTPAGDSGEIITGADGSITIPLSRFDSGVFQVALKSGDTAMELLCHLGSDGTPKLSWNTCRVCNGSPYAYFEYKNDRLTCKNCGNTFPADSIGENGNGCYPWAVAEYTVENGAVTVSAAAAADMAPYFKNWKKGI